MRVISILVCVGVALVVAYRATRPRYAISTGYYDATSPRHLDAEIVLIEDGYLAEAW